jgi:hypothetical protein
MFDLVSVNVSELSSKKIQSERTPFTNGLVEAETIIGNPLRIIEHFLPVIDNLSDDTVRRSEKSIKISFAVISVPYAEEIVGFFKDFLSLIQSQ